jgi:nucleotide-binding universal stress UspA family protein
MSEPDAPVTSAEDAGTPNYLVVVDDTAESGSALRYASRRARGVGGNVVLLHVIPEQEFLQWGGVQDMIAAEAQEAAQALLSRKADEVFELSGLRPSMAVRQGKPTDQVAKAIEEDASIKALVLGAAAKGAPGPLVTFFSGERAGNLPCVVVIVPGGLDDEAIDRLT